MTRAQKTVLHPSRVPLLRQRLNELTRQFDPQAHLHGDPLVFLHRYTDLRDQEVAGLFASGLAFGRVAAFWPVVNRILDQADAAGGPFHWAQNLDATGVGMLMPLQYRWVRGPDLALVAHTVAAVLTAHGSIGHLLKIHHQARAPTFGPALAKTIEVFRAEAVRQAQRVGLKATRWSDLSRGFRSFFPSPAGGSACKRWNMLLRWMVRTEAPDLGRWDLPTSALTIPLDTHVLRLAHFVGLTRRTDGSWRTAEDITRNLRRLDPSDPVRFDFAMAHLGISGACKMRRIPTICDACAVCPVCRVGRPGTGR